VVTGVHLGKKSAICRYRPTWRSQPCASSHCMASPTCRSPVPHHAAAKRQEKGVGAWGVCYHLHASNNRKPS
jgi:hypothetical protein